MEPTVRGELSEELTEFLLLKIVELSVGDKTSIKTFLPNVIFRTEGDTNVNDSRLELVDETSTCEVA